MVTSSHIGGELYLAILVNIPDKALVLATLRALKLGMFSCYIFLEMKSILFIHSYNLLELLNKAQYTTELYTFTL